jgi:hypothetical protein
MNIYNSPPRKNLLLAPSGSLKQRTINITKECLLEHTPSDTKTKKIVPKQVQEFGFSVRKPQSNIHWTPNIKNKKKKSKIRPQQKVAKVLDYPARDGVRVRFKKDEDGNIQQTFAEVPSHHYLTKEDIANNWWTKKELVEIKETANELCRFYLTERPGYKNAVVRLLMRCGAQRTTHGDIFDIVSVFENTEFEEEDDVSTLVDGDTRGLEKRMILSMLLPFHRHKRSINSLLDSQKRLWAIDPTYFTNDQRARLIATQYGLNSAYATKWAHKIALGDARGVQRNFTFDW